MGKVEILEISVASDGKLNIYPKLKPHRDFAHIYRAAMGVTWDSEKSCLLPQKTKSWGHFEWFKQITAAVGDEYHKELFLSANTRWYAVPEEIRIKIEKLMNECAD